MPIAFPEIILLLLFCVVSLVLTKRFTQKTPELLISIPFLLLTLIFKKFIFLIFIPFIFIFLKNVNKKLIRYLVNTILYVLLWCIVFLPAMKYSMDSGSVSAPAIGGIVALIISYIAVKSINRSNLWSKLFNDKDLTKGELDKPQKQSVELKKNIDMDKNTKFVISKGWLRIHIVLSLLVTAGVFIAELDAYGDFGVTLAVFITYWLVVGCVVWIIKGFKESGKN